MEKQTVSPLHKVIDAGRWDDEPPLGRLVMLVHAAFLAAGFVPHGNKSGWLPKELGSTASTLSLLYTAPQLLHRPFAELAVVSLLACGRHVVIYVRFSFVHGWPDADAYFMRLDALAAAPLLSGGLDDTARALRNGTALAAFWTALSDGMCRCLYVKLCRRYGVPLEPTFMSLPDDVKVAILGMLADSEDLLRVERTCTELRCLVGEHDEELWKPRFETLAQRAASCSIILPDDDDGVGAGNSEDEEDDATGSGSSEDEEDDGVGAGNSEDDDDDGGSGTVAGSWEDDDGGTGTGSSEEDDGDDGSGPGYSEVSSWKVRYMRAKRTIDRRDPWFFLSSWRRSFQRDLTRSRCWILPTMEHDDYMPLFNRLRPWLGQTAGSVLGRRKRSREEKRRNSIPTGHDRSRPDIPRKKQRHPKPYGVGAIHSPSSRFQWKHR